MGWGVLRVGWGMGHVVQWMVVVVVGSVGYGTRGGKCGVSLCGRGDGMCGRMDGGLVVGGRCGGYVVDGWWLDMLIVGRRLGVECGIGVGECECHCMGGVMGCVVEWMVLMVLMTGEM